MSMNLQLLGTLRYWSSAAGYCVAVTTIIVAHHIGFGLWWYLVALPLMLGPQVVYLILARKAWKYAPARPVWAVITRAITSDEKARLERKFYQVNNMYVSGVRVAPSPPDAALLLYKDLKACMDGEFGVEELATRNLDSARRVVSMAGRADEVIADLLEMNHRGHSEGERPS